MPSRSRFPVADTVRRHFAAELERRGYRADAAQQHALEHLACWLEAFLGPRWLRLRQPPAGVYLWGGIGRGKSFVMDAFFAAAPLQAKRRVHFHAFLQELQERIRMLGGQPDPLALAARQIAAQTRLLCFDEFHVHDIGDAMLLGRLLDVMVKAGVGLVTTSNYPPAGLCPNPLYRERFAPAIGLIERRFDVLPLDAGIDYRQRADGQYVWGEFAWPEAAGDHSYLRDWLGLGPDARHDVTLSVNHHPLAVRGEAEGRLWLDFLDLCARPHSTGDYLWLIRRYPRIALSGVVALAGQPPDVSQRFLNFVDIAYDQGTELLVSSSVDLARLCDGPAQADFVRTRSRLAQLRLRPLETLLKCGRS